MELDFRKAVLDYKDTVYKIAYAGCGNSYDADDILQDVFFALCQGRKKFDSEEHLKAWLIRVTVNRVKSHLRSFHVKKRAVIEENLVTAGEDIEETEELRLIREAVMALPENYRIAIILYYYCGYSCAEIANILKMKEPTVKTRLKRARDKLKIQLREEICYDRQE